MKNEVNNEVKVFGYTLASEEKYRIRQQILSMRNGLDEETRQEFSHKIVTTFLGLNLVVNARAIHTYLSFGTEVETSEILAAGFATDKKIITSVIAPVDGTLVHTEITPHTRFTRGKFGVPTPVGSTTVTTIELGLTPDDIIAVPIVAFDRRRNRLGYGKGYYDRFLSETTATRVGLAFSCQEAPLIPAEPHDALLDIIVTEIGMFD